MVGRGYSSLPDAVHRVGIRLRFVHGPKIQTTADAVRTGPPGVGLGLQEVEDPCARTFDFNGQLFGAPLIMLETRCRNRRIFVDGTSWTSGATAASLEALEDA